MQSHSNGCCLPRAASIPASKAGSHRESQSQSTGGVTSSPLFSCVTLANARSNIKARSVEIDPTSESVNIKWENDTPGFSKAHTTKLSLAALREINKSGSLPGFGRDTNDPQILWAKEPLPNLKDFDYEDYLKDDREVYKLIHQLRTGGLAFVTNVPGKVESLATIAERIGPVQDTFYGRTWDVRTVPQANNAAYTSADLGFHTDLLYFQNPPHVQLLHCVQSASKGGASVFADAYKSAVDLFRSDSEAFETLATIPVNYHYNHPNDNVYRTTKPVIDLRPLRIGDKLYTRVQDYAKDYHDLSLQNGGSGWSDAVLVDHTLKINWGPPFLAPFSNHQDPIVKKQSDQSPLLALNDKVEKWHQAASKFNALLQRSEYLFERKMKSGDCVLFDNTRILHSRRAFDMADVGKPRWLRGTYVDKDSYFILISKRLRFPTTLHDRHVMDADNAPKIKHTRKGAAKSRNGCSKCKARRIKCDERRPSCENCVKLKFPCPGYQRQLRWAHKHQRTETLIPQETISRPDDWTQDAPHIGQVTQVWECNTQAESTGLQNVLDALQDESISMGHDCDFAWLTEAPPTFQVTDLDLREEHIDEPLWNSFNILERPRVSQHGLTSMSNPSIVHRPVHLSTTLIEYWFQHICPVRSTFDSEVNNNRSLARNSWGTSEAVFYTMQAMSAACLVHTLPHLSEILPTLREQATLAIAQGISRVRSLRVAQVTADLVFAVLAMGTSSHWVTPNSDYPWLESARELLSIWSVGISAADALLHAYFRQALAYWEMLLTVVGPGSKPSNLEKRRQKYHGRLRRAMLLEADDVDDISYGNPSMNSNLKPLGTLPNSWCGISNEVIETFGQVLALCRSACERNQDKAALTLDMTSKALCDIAVAHELEKELLSMDFDTMVLLEEVQGFYVDTLDNNTPVTHLLQTAEVYRKAGLLQLYLTFDDLVVNTSGGCDKATSIGGAADGEPRSKSLADLALQLVGALEGIPVESGSKFIHPMLYVSAAAGLRFDKYFDFHCPGMSGEINSDQSYLFASPMDWNSLEPTQAQYLPKISDTVAMLIPQSILKIANARRLVWSRLSMIRHALPYKASDSFLRLVKTIWLEYDKARSDTSTNQWFKILTHTGLEMPL
ncbi:hypothetical protein FPSE_08073 [Fusarium pseudograminearum CS3096]|uniref:Zn(2)-C6 fungal-type domain-containing protein n=1 Tax=Fusarium pseudograminearum (strain CS3096) TaxID=1028729 RepID=K3VCF9_FUSPC|nr:hypothetical protein FPSE_08073 [Fusarium pseudograminearum CS3096]EKJ71627.1 hypothetical protein FPSE_08073 [Fusarium pseudograminearum CS3096]